ncbi:MAG TPA: hypothetical protein VGC54_11490 [Planctomycetota bacterium]
MLHRALAVFSLAALAAFALPACGETTDSPQTPAAGEQAELCCGGACGTPQGYCCTGVCCPDLPIYDLAEGDGGVREGEGG